MKILYIVEGFGGGIYSFLKDLSNNICSEFEIVLACTKRPETPQDFQDEFDKRIKIIDIGMNRNINLIKDTKDLVKIIRLIKSEEADIIHLHSSKSGFLGRLACFLLRINTNRVFYNPHGFSFLQENFSNRKRKLFFLLEKIAAYMPGNIIAVSKGEARESLKLSNKVLRVDNAIDSNQIDNLIKVNNSIQKDKDFLIGTSGRISYQKNPKMFNLIAKEFKCIKFLWIGDGELRAELNSPNIEITGWMSREDAIQEMQKINIYIQTSLWEGLPIALLEAMYIRRPIVANNVIGNNDVVTNEYNGLLCNNINDFIKAIDRLTQDNNLIYKMGSNSRKYVIENHLLKDMTDKYKKIYLGNFEYIKNIK